jgi:hypothetical protein
MWATFVIFKKQSKVNNHTMGKNSPNLVILAITCPQQRSTTYYMYVLRQVKHITAVHSAA